MPELDDAVLERRLRAVLSEHLGALPLDLTVEALDRRRAARGVARPFGRGRAMTLLAAAALLLAGGALVGSGMLRLPSVVPPAPAPSLGQVTTASPDATSTPKPSASPSPSPAPLSLEVTWTQVPLVEQAPQLAWLGDRFVLADTRSGAVRTSPDGEDWQELRPGEAANRYLDLLKGSRASWQDSVVQWWNPEERLESIAGAPPITARDVVQIVLPPAAPISTTPFKGRIESIGIGPKGIVAEVHSDLDTDAWITAKLGLRENNDWVNHLEDITFENGVLEVKLDNRPGLKVVWADEGFALGDYMDGGFGWYSPDGEHWTEMAPNDDSGTSLPSGEFGSVVGVSDGFIATGAYPRGTCPGEQDSYGSCTGMWYSSDGLTWRRLGTQREIRGSTLPGGLLPWRGGALAIDEDGHVTFWTSGGSTELPIVAQVHGTAVTGPLGFVSIGDDQAVVSRDGIDYKVSSLPAEMADIGHGQGGSTFVAVGDRTVLVFRMQWPGEPDMTQSLWLGTFEP